MNAGRRIARLAGAALVLAAALGGGALSGSLSPSARRPLLDGLGPAVPYRWVEPPSYLRPSNRPPTPGRFPIALGPNGSPAEVFATDDLQVTIVASAGLIPARDDGGRAVLEVTPISATGLAPPPDGLVAAGNAVRIGAAYDPGPVVRGFGARAGDIVLTYPSLPTIHGEGHEILWSTDGEQWHRLDTRDTPELGQAEAPLERPGVVLVAGRPKPAPTPTGRSGSRQTLWVALLVGAISAALIGAGILLRLRAER
jgi:hypothetical protein